MWNRRRNRRFYNLGLSTPQIPPAMRKTPMPVRKSNLYRQTTSRLEEVAAIDKQLAKLEDDIRRLKIDFDIYFNGGSKRPPLEARARLEALLKRVADNRSLSFAQRYQLSTLTARFTAYRELWRRTLRSRGEELI